jgi:hypothetical protein
MGKYLPQPFVALFMLLTLGFGYRIVNVLAPNPMYGAVGLGELYLASLCLLLLFCSRRARWFRLLTR